jgi:hypothetical protein
MSSTTMTAVRAAGYVGSAALMAWLASATSVSRHPETARVPRSSADGQQLDAIASDVQSQATRLRHRLATAPAPQASVRNPFEFGSRAPERRHTAAHAEPPAAEPAPADVEPPLALIGVAEQKTPVGLVRTAMIGQLDGQFVMVTEGQEVAGRYRVAAVGADTVDLKDASGAIRRLVMK